MDGFKQLPKMQHFKEGGGVKNAYCGGGKAYKKGGEVHNKADVKEDKKLIKKAFAMHDKQEHEGEKTDLSKLKKGGRSKKAVGTVKKFEKAAAPSKAEVKKKSPIINKKEGGAIGMKKTAEDKKKIATIKKEKAEKLCGGGKAKKYADGGPTAGQGAVTEKERSIFNTLKDNIMGTPEQNAAARKNLDKLAQGQGALSDVERKIRSVTGQGAVAKKKGGKIKKMASGSLTGAIADTMEYVPGLTDEPIPFDSFGATPEGALDDGMTPVMYSLGSPMVQRDTGLGNGPVGALANKRAAFQQRQLARQQARETRQAANQQAHANNVVREQAEKIKKARPTRPGPLPTTAPGGGTNSNVGNWSNATGGTSYGSATQNPVLPDAEPKYTSPTGPLVQPANPTPVNAVAQTAQPAFTGNPMNGQFAAMKRGGVAARYAAGGGVDDILGQYKNAVREGRDLDPGIMAKQTPRKLNIEGEEYEVRPAPMPMPKSIGKVKVPGMGEFTPAKEKSRGAYSLLKKGGKAKGKK